ncbi:MAG: hypothetical protein RLZZ502_1910 [Pseudomonadota bacterium]|jgi:outer membrane scaffolding protein for murein synthesis (MipA/OmpV family)
MYKFLLAMLVPALGAAESLWELGLGAGALVVPDYRGSNQTRAYAVPMPYVIYRGEVFKMDRDGLRAQLLASTGMALDISAAGSFPVNSEKNEARKGMPNLGGSVELGPSLNVNLWTSGSNKLELRLPVRAVITAGKGQGIDYNGLVFTPRLNIDFKNIAGWDYGSYVGLNFADKRHHDYFYTVSPLYATSTRKAYEAKAGYGGASWVAGMSRRIDKVWVGAFVRADSLHGASFSDSPLVKSKTAFYGGLGFAYVFYESGEHSK